MAIAKQMGWNNPFTDFVGQNRNTLMGFGAGLASGRNFGDGIAAGLQYGQQGKIADVAQAQQAEEAAKLEQQTNVTRSWLEQQGFTDLVPLVDAGQAGLAYGEALKRMQPGSAPDPFTLGAGEIRYDGFGNVLAQGPTSSRTENAPSGYQYTPDGNLAYIPGGPADPSTQAKTTEAQRRNQQLASVIQPELASVEQNWEELANPQNQVGGMIPGVGNAVTSSGYQQARNSLSVIAQSYLYSVSGAAATDAEVQKIVDSVTPRPFESPQTIAAKKARIQQMADAVIQAGGGAPAQPAPSASGGWQVLGVE